MESSGTKVVRKPMNEYDLPNVKDILIVYDFFQRMIRRMYIFIPYCLLCVYLYMYTMCWNSLELKNSSLRGH